MEEFGGKRSRVIMYNCPANGFKQNHNLGLVFDEYLILTFRYISRDIITVHE